MPRLRQFAIVMTLLAVWASVPAHAIFISQDPTDPPPELRTAGSGILMVISDIYRTIADLESGELDSARDSFTDLRARLLDAASQFDSFANDLATSKRVDLSRISEQLRARTEQVLRNDSVASRVIGVDGVVLSMPSNDVDVYAQTARVVRALATELTAAENLPSRGATIASIVRFRSLTAALSQAINVLSLHSILLSTIR